jgi:uncharacterized protein YbjT (DUF2867 family)
MRVLVTGARGHVGREVVRACLERGLGVRAAVREVDGAGRPSVRDEIRGVARPIHDGGSDGGGETARFDFHDRGTWRAALEGCELLFLLRPPAIARVSTTMIPFVELAYERGVEHVVFLSVSGAERASWIPHRRIELFLERTLASWTVLRPGFFAQNLGDAYRRDLADDDRLYVPAGRGRVAFLDVRDAGDVAACVLADPKAHRRAFLTLTGPEALTFDDVARVLSSALDRTIRYEPATVLGYTRHLLRRGLPPAQIAVQTILHLGLRRGDAERVDDTVRAVLGREATPLADYVARSVHLW